MPINDYDPAMIEYADIYAYYGGSNHNIASTPSTAEISTTGVITAIIDPANPLFDFTTGPITISIKVGNYCALDSVSWSESVKLHD